MEPFMIMILILLGQVILDSVGDGCRARGWQKIHHSIESLQIGIWLSLLPAIYFGWLDFQWYYIWMYVLGRIWLFDLVINPIMKQKLFYVSDTSWDGVIYYLISGDGNPNRKKKWPVENFSFIFKLMAFVWWIGWFISNKDTISIFIGR
jgi:hypothetical protein